MSTARLFDDRPGFGLRRRTFLALPEVVTTKAESTTPVSKMQVDDQECRHATAAGFFTSPHSCLLRGARGRAA
jgi:hypothetical protein